MKKGPILFEKTESEVRVRSVTRFVLDGVGPCETITVVQVWRNETDEGPWLLSNMDLHNRAKEFHQSACREIAYALIEMDRVARVEVVCYFTGEGVELRKDD